jgi:hypothetical protein
VVTYFICAYQVNPVIGALYVMKLCQLLESDIQLLNIYSAATSAKVKKMRIYTSTLSYAFMA